MILLAGILLGVLLAFLLPVYISPAISPYVAIAILAALDSVFGGLNAHLMHKFNMGLFLSGFFSNSILAFLLAYIGTMLNIDFTLVALIVFGVRLFNNFGSIRHLLYKKICEKNKNF